MSDQRPAASCKSDDPTQQTCSWPLCDCPRRDTPPDEIYRKGWNDAMAEVIGMLRGKQTELGNTAVDSFIRHLVGRIFLMKKVSR